MSVLKVKDDNNSWVSLPAGGVGVPSGGTQGQVLYKTGSADYATGWGTASAIGAMSKWTLLWTNASPNSIFADQTVAIDLTNYDIVLVYFTANVGAGPMEPVLAIKGEATSAESIWSGWAAFRNFTPQNNGVVFDKGYYKSNFGNSSAESAYNNYIIPEKIYAAKCLS